MSKKDLWSALRVPFISLILIVSKAAKIGLCLSNNDLLTAGHDAGQTDSEKRKDRAESMHIGLQPAPKLPRARPIVERAPETEPMMARMR